MELVESIKFIEKQIKQLEQVIYNFETVMQPRFDQDKKILETMRSQQLKMQALLERSNKGEEISQDELYDSVPAVFR